MNKKYFRAGDIVMNEYLPIPPQISLIPMFFLHTLTYLILIFVSSRLLSSFFFTKAASRRA